MIHRQGIILRFSPSSARKEGLKPSGHPTYPFVSLFIRIPDIK
ncbi:hypothetical protein HMPREF3293_00458 [Christensenella minuta]|uniref:Uncharacterized protein n=1 Tax=Christensenella minuta TaxID=626937 RepID=A0A136Q7H0_9FIRM|nr:hypothetical protein HMPREF3293_00458 [Christensenella minuta]